MEDLGYRVTSEFTRIIGNPSYLFESRSGSGVFYIVKSYACTDDHFGFVDFDPDLELVLGRDLIEQENNERFRLNLSDGKYPGNLIEALRDFATLRGFNYISINHCKRSKPGFHRELIIVKPRLFVPVFDTGVNLHVEFGEDLETDTTFN